MTGAGEEYPFRVRSLQTIKVAYKCHDSEAFASESQAETNPRKENNVKRLYFEVFRSLVVTVLRVFCLVSP